MSKTIEIKYNGKIGETAETPFGIWTKGELHAVEESVAKQMLRTGMYELKGAKLATPNHSPDIDPQEEAEGAAPAVQPGAFAPKKSKK